ncbi:MAG: A/G-specific adenine glycosylase [Verrucomicrobiota bacterium]|nr:A/G-specific adenine glycosylase [Verrucomicrobiota bacterium]
MEAWFLENRRSFPWRDKPTPYRIWVSEVMLQQTRAQVVGPYFERWMKLFPDIVTLAAAPLEQVIKAWEGLGYYSRARNLHAGAQQVMREYNGELPCSKEKLLSIRGLGPYTVGAILSFGFHQRAAAVDGNVERVVTRYFWIAEDVKKVATKRKIEQAAEGLLNREQPWVTAEALIELGATICLPKPRCEACPLRMSCQAHAKGQVDSLPLKPIPPKIEKIVRGVAIVEAEGCVLLRKNPEGQLMGGLSEFPYFEGKQTLRAVQKELEGLLGKKLELMSRLPPVEHSFTRFSAHLFPFHFRLKKKVDHPSFPWVPIAELAQYPFSSGHRKIFLERCNFWRSYGLLESKS